MAGGKRFQVATPMSHEKSFGTWASSMNLPTEFQKNAWSKSLAPVMHENETPWFLEVSEQNLHR